MIYLRTICKIKQKISRVRQIKPYASVLRSAVAINFYVAALSKIYKYISF
ncbi:hypothetical protein HanXRQr2_Chr03g0096951 [Helianthus annuus]|uniref:Uncharacterized protein n=1 Tax=Helianthus annuus TaxID=4232 RepID=A0A9K3NVR5_HELAN|nr:hypothetical protein HanXRQr2_Chr03g0096951 [Helianthus annuus]KAJ0942565.1 hypothetical protein HanPSC8_Chr03g0093471 [Helianthus annuus]